MSSPAPGWYYDGHGYNRWWDGTQWTKRTQRVKSSTPKSGFSGTMQGLAEQLASTRDEITKGVELAKPLREEDQRRKAERAAILAAQRAAREAELAQQRAAEEAKRAAEEAERAAWIARTVAVPREDPAGEPFRGVVAAYQAAGFINIEVIPVKDLRTKLFGKIVDKKDIQRFDGEVSKVKIDGIAHDSAQERYPRDVLVQVKYHTFRGSNAIVESSYQPIVAAPMVVTVGDVSDRLTKFVESVTTEKVRSTSDKIRELSELYMNGVFSGSEYEAAKAKALELPAPTKNPDTANVGLLEVTHYPIPEPPKATTPKLVVPPLPVDPLAITAPAITEPAQTDSEHDKIKRLAELHASGLLTDAEYSAAKAKVLGI